MAKLYTIGEQIDLPAGARVEHLRKQPSAAELEAQREAAQELHLSITGRSRTKKPRLQWPGRRDQDHRPWIALIVVALFAVASPWTPDEWKLAPPPVQRICE